MWMDCHQIVTKRIFQTFISWTTTLSDYNWGQMRLKNWNPGHRDSFSMSVHGDSWHWLSNGQCPCSTSVVTKLGSLCIIFFFSTPFLLVSVSTQLSYSVYSFVFTFALNSVLLVFDLLSRADVTFQCHQIWNSDTVMLTLETILRQAEL